MVVGIAPPGSATDTAERSVRTMTNEQVTEMRFARLYPLLEAKAVKKGRTREEVQQVVTWLTGYSAGELK